MWNEALQPSMLTTKCDFSVLTKCDFSVLTKCDFSVLIKCDLPNGNKWKWFTVPILVSNVSRGRGLPYHWTLNYNITSASVMINLGTNLNLKDNTSSCHQRN